MTQKLAQWFRKHCLMIGLIYTVAIAVFDVSMTDVIWTALPDVLARSMECQFDLGVDAICAVVAAGLFYGCMHQEGDGTREFKILNLLVSTSFLVNYLLYLTVNVPENLVAPFICALIHKLLDLFMIYFFYQYVRNMLGFKGKLAQWMDKGVPILLGLECLVILSNIFFPLTFRINEKGLYEAMAASSLEDIYLAVVSVSTTILILRCDQQKSQKKAALTFIFLPVVNYITIGGVFGAASQYGMILVSLIVMYCIIFIDKSNKLAATQTELNMATRIQIDALPPTEPEFDGHPNVNLRASMNTAKEVGGDFFDYFAIDDDHICFLIADVSGKGTPAALFMMTSKTMIKDYGLIQGSTSEIFNSVNARLCENNEAGMFATSWIGILDTRTMTLQFTNAGHNYPMLQRKGQPCEEIKKNHGLFLGGMEFTRYKQAEIQLEPGDRLLLFTDGVVEAHDKRSELYGNERLQKVMDDGRDLPGDQLLKRIFDDVSEYATGVPQFDDITMVVLSIIEYEVNQNDTDH